MRVIGCEYRNPSEGPGSNVNTPSPVLPKNQTEKSDLIRASSVFDVKRWLEPGFYQEIKKSEF
jgi:hypothetical protein